MNAQDCKMPRSATVPVRPRSRCGFTLIEMLVAIALASIIMSVVVVAFSQGILIYKQSGAKIEATRSADAVLRILEDDLRGIPQMPMLLVGAPDYGGGKIKGVDTDEDGDFDENLFVDTYRRERHGLELVTMARFGASAGQLRRVVYFLTRDGTTDNGYPVGRLIRVTGDAMNDDRDADVDGVERVNEDPLNGIDDDGDGLIDEDPDGVNSSWLKPSGYVARPGYMDIGPEDEWHAKWTLVYGVTQFKLRYYYKGVWFDGWDTDLGGWDGVVGVDPDDPAFRDDIQFQRSPQVIEVTLEVIDYDQYLDRDGQNPVKMVRLIKVGP